MEKVGLGLFGLQEYANEYWIFHVLHYVEAKGGPLDRRSPLLTQLLRFATKHADIAKARTHTPSGLSASARNPIQDSISEKLQIAPEIHNLICQVLSFQQELDAKQASEGPGKSTSCGRLRDCANLNNSCTEILATELDPTVLSNANWKYNDAVKSLVCASSCAGLSPAELQTFQSEYRRTAFICTVRNCERSRFGYPSAVELKDHKTRQHTTGFKCYHQECPLRDIGFISSRSLREHKKRFHLTDLPAIPKTLKRKHPGDGPPEDMGTITPMSQRYAAMPPPADPNSNQSSNTDLPVSALEGGPTSPYCCRMLLTLDVRQKYGLDFASPFGNNDGPNDFDFDSFLHDNEGDAVGFDFSAANFMIAEAET